MQVIYTEWAKHDFDSALIFYQSESLTLAEQFKAAVLDAIDNIEIKPFMVGSCYLNDSSYHNVFHFRLKLFPYSIIYKVDKVEKQTIIIAIAHHRRRPNYWDMKTAKE